MIRSRPLATMLVALVAASLAAWPLGATAQDTPTTPEGIDWKLTSYTTAGVATPVPFGVNATLRMDAGLATGSGGCNTFSGAYALDGTSLMFDDQVSTTLALCPAPVQVVEDAYLAALPQVTGWVLSGDALELQDSLGATILRFEIPGAGLTSSELTSLATTLTTLRSEIAVVRTELATAREEVEGLNVDRLRERVRDLESLTEDLQAQLDALEGSGGTDGGGNTALTQAESILLEGVSPRIASRCVPLRSGLPKGSFAGVRCSPDSAVVANLDYFLLDGEDAALAFQGTMETFNVPEAVSETETCAQGVKSQRVLLGNGWQSEGCYRTNLRAELRFVDNATDCRQLRVGQKRIPSPTVYVALQGSNQDVAAAHAWATRSLDETSGQVTSITRPIERPRERVAAHCVE